MKWFFVLIGFILVGSVFVSARIFDDVDKSYLDLFKQGAKLNPCEYVQEDYWIDTKGKLNSVMVTKIDVSCLVFENNKRISVLEERVFDLEKDLKRLEEAVCTLKIFNWCIIK